MRARHSNAIRMVDKFSQHITAVHNANSLLFSSNQFAVIRMDGRRNNHRVSALHLLRRMPLVNHSAQRFQLLAHAARIPVRTGNVKAALAQHMRQSAHARAADTNKMYIVYSRKH